jgi:hypothetical protein
MAMVWLKVLLNDSTSNTVGGLDLKEARLFFTGAELPVLLGALSDLYSSISAIKINKTTVISNGSVRLSERCMVDNAYNINIVNAEKGMIFPGFAAKLLSL